MPSALRRASLLCAVALAALTACNKDPTPAELKLAQANDLYRKQDYAAAAAAMQESLQLDPNQPQAIWDKCAFSWKKAGKLDLAGDTLFKAAETRQKPEEKLANMRNGAGMYLEGRLIDKAEPAFRKVLEADPKDTDSLAWLAEILATKGGARKADAPVLPEVLEQTLPLYDKLIELQPTGQPVVTHNVNKRIVLTRLIAFYNQQAAVFADADSKKAVTDKADKHKAELDAISAKLPDLIKAAKGGAAPAAAPAPAGAAPAAPAK
jgi:tetratricopeptide (TPR) repeat protein